jgi:hypothetical protein
LETVEWAFFLFWSQILVAGFTAAAAKEPRRLAAAGSPATVSSMLRCRCLLVGEGVSKEFPRSGAC